MLALQECVCPRCPESSCCIQGIVCFSSVLGHSASTLQCTAIAMVRNYLQGFAVFVFVFAFMHKHVPGFAVA